MKTSSCPPQQALTDWVLGDVPEHQVDGILDHLDCCEDCEKFVSKLEVLEPIAECRSAGDFTDEPECQSLVDMLSLPRPSVPLKGRSRNLSGTSIRDYQLLRPLGRGGMGTVYLARHTRLNKLVAVKLVPEHSHDDPMAVARFEREMQAVGLLDHPNVVSAFDAGDVDGLYFLTMELVDGADLSRLTKKRRTLSVADSCEIIRQAAEGMQYAHDQGLIHRDIKPSNLMLGREKDGFVRTKILDLGLATLPDTAATDDPVSDPNLLVGTLEYMAPEQSEDKEDVNHLADIYSLGATFYRLLTGYLPFHGLEYRKPVHRLLALNSEDAPGVSTVCADIPPALANIVDRMLSRDRTDRPQSMAEVAEAVASFTADADLSALLTDVPLITAEGRFCLPAPPESFAALADTSPSVGCTVTDFKNDHRTDEDASASKGGFPPRWLAVTALIPLVILSAVIWIKTDSGFIRLEHDDNIEVTLEFLRDGEPVDGFRIDQNEREMSFRTGRYEVRLPPGSDDSMRIQNARFTLERNGRQIVRIERMKDDGKRAIDTTASTDTINTPGWQWEEPVHLGKTLNTEWKDDQPTISADGLTMIFGSFCIPRFAGEGDRDLWMTTRDDGNSPWKTVSNLGPVINSPMKEMHPSLHSESELLAFASNRGGGVGKVDLWYSNRDAESQEWTRPVNMGPKANSESDDDNPEVSSDGLSLYFASTRDGGSGGNDIWLCRRDNINGRWNAAERLPEPVNTEFVDSEPALSRDQLTLIFTSDRPGGVGGRDLWASTRSAVTEPWGSPFNLGAPVNTPEDESHAAFLPDGKSLVFASRRNGGLGATDLWTVKRVEVRAAESTAVKNVSVPLPKPTGKPPAMAVIPFDADSATKHQQAWADHWSVPVDFQNSIGMKFRLIPPGEFLMGAPDEEHAQALALIDEPRPTQMNMDRESALIRSEHPQQCVRITQPFYIGSTEVTEEQFDRVLGRLHPPFHVEGPEHAVGLISWNRAAQFCNELSRREGLPERYKVEGRSAWILPVAGGYRMPTEAEWEFSCRAGTTTAFPFGDDSTSIQQYAWCQQMPERKETSPPMAKVGRKKPNAFGIYDLLGNCWEWCEDSGSLPQVSGQLLIDPLVDDGQRQQHRIGRGGFVSSIATDLRSARRRSHLAGMPYQPGGFRVVLAIGSEAIVPIESESETAEVLGDTPALRDIARWAVQQQGHVAVNKGRLLRTLTEIPDEVSSIESIEARHCSAGETTRLLSGLKQTLSCRQLSLQDVEMTMEVAGELAAVKSLRHICLSSPTVADEHLEQFSILPNLKELMLSNTSISVRGLKSIVANCPALRTLDIYSTVLTDTDIKVLAELRQLRNLALNLQLSSIQPLAGSPIQSLTLRGAWESEFPTQFQALPALSVIHLHHCKALNDADLFRLENIETLKELWIHDESSVTATGIIALATRRPEVTIYLDCPLAEDEALQYLHWKQQNSAQPKAYRGSMSDLNSSR